MKYLGGFILLGMIFGCFLFGAMWCPAGMVSGCGDIPSFASQSHEFSVLAVILIIMGISYPIIVAVFIAAHLGETFKETVQLIKKYLSKEK
jgi:hypothetical protein